MYAVLIQLYTTKKNAGQKIELTKADNETLAQVMPGKKLPKFVFMEDVTYTLEPTVLPAKAEQFEPLRPDWGKRMGELVAAYGAIRTSVAGAYAEVLKQQMSITDPSRVGYVGQRVGQFYQQQALQGTRPFRSRESAANPGWFLPSEMRTWAAFADAKPVPPVDLVAAWFAAYQKVLHAARKGCLDGENGWLVPAVWMVADPAAPPAGDTLFGYARDVFLQRIARRAPLDATMTSAELGQLAGTPEAGNAVFYFLAVRALGEVMGPQTAPRPTTRFRPLLGFASETFDSAYYSGHGIKEALMTAHYGKCAFCECKVRAVAHGDVEHFRPKAGYEQGRAFNHDGYFWRAYDWRNLYYSCQVCNQVYKGNHFPVLLGQDMVERRKSYTDDDAPESPVLIDPGVEDPREFIRFDPRTGYAYPYDLLKFYLHQSNVGDQKVTPGVPDVPTAIWTEPRLIPDPYAKADGYDTQPMAVPNVFMDPDSWLRLTARVPGVLLRGTRTIQLLGLNRADLVTRRVAHLRALRGLFTVAAYGSGPEQAAATDAINRSMAPDSEFSSLSIDALNTWNAEKTRLAQPNKQAWPWLARYNVALASPPVYTDDEGWVEKDIPIMYYVAEGTDPRVQRSVVYFKLDDKIEESALPPGWFLDIPEEDYHLTLTVRRPGKPDETLTIGELFQLGPQAWRKFNNSAAVTATGAFSVPVMFG